VLEGQSTLLLAHEDACFALIRSHESFRSVAIIRNRLWSLRDFEADLVVNSVELIRLAAVAAHTSVRNPRGYLLGNVMPHHKRIFVP